MDKVRFSCPRCRTVMQTGVEKIGYDVACPNCAHRFRLVDSQSPPSSDQASGQERQPEDVTLPPSHGPTTVGLSDRATPVGGSYSNRVPSPDKPPSVSSLKEPTEPVYARQSHFCCPYCQTNAPPIVKSEVSTVGWIVFSILLFTTCFGCFIGLLIRDRYRICSQCKIRLD